MKTDYIYWNTFYEYLINNFKLNGDLTHDAKVIKETQYLWQEASKRYMKNIKPKDLAKMYCNFNKNEWYNYKDFYSDFISYLSYASDRMVSNRWLYLQMCINYLSDLIYKEWIMQNNWKTWTDKIENGWSETQSCTQLQEDCANEFKTIIKPLIIENQKSERKTKIKNEIQN